jgi:hypothetical protein
MSEDPFSNPLSELGHISLTARQLSQSTAQLAASTGQLSTSAGQIAANAGQVSRDLQHSTEVFTPILAELTGELKRLRVKIDEGARAASRSAWALVFATIALVIATLVMAWPMWFPKIPAQAPTPPVVSSPAPKSN